MNTQEIEIPDVWVERLKELQKDDPLACIAGGAIRDLFCGVIPKDVDFFSTHLPSTWGDALTTSFDYQGMQYVQGVVEFRCENDLPYNMIVIEPVQSIEQLISSFDFGFCQIAFDGNQVIKTSAFDWDYKFSLMTMTKIDRYARSVKRFARISQRYSSINIAIPELEKLNAQLSESSE